MLVRRWCRRSSVMAPMQTNAIERDEQRVLDQRGALLVVEAGPQPVARNSYEVIIGAMLPMGCW